MLALDLRVATAGLPVIPLCRRWRCPSGYPGIAGTSAARRKWQLAMGLPVDGGLQLPAVVHVRQAGSYRSLLM